MQPRCLDYQDWQDACGKLRSLPTPGCATGAAKLRSYSSNERDPAVSSPAQTGTRLERVTDT